MKNVPTCFICYDADKTYGPYTIKEALAKIDAFARGHEGMAPELVQVWNLSWRSSQPLHAAKPFLLADLRKSKYSLDLEGTRRALESEPA
jgi:hypothetical protein